MFVIVDPLLWMISDPAVFVYFAVLFFFYVQICITFFDSADSYVIVTIGVTECQKFFGSFLSQNI